MTKEEKRIYDQRRYAAIRSDYDLLERKRAQARKATLDYYYRNREQQIAKVGEWRKSNRKRRLAQKARYRELHPGALRAWHARNPNKNGHYIHARRIRKLGNGGAHTLKEWLALVEAHGGACVYCRRTGLKLTKDHKVPLSLGGSDDIENIAPACKSCNSAKGKMSAERFLKMRGTGTCAAASAA